MQDIPIFNGNDSTQLEDWLVGIETAANMISWKQDINCLRQVKMTNSHFNLESS